jgi:hypothetical protein
MTLLEIDLCAFSVLLVVTVALIEAFRRRLKMRHSEVWERLGSPSFLSTRGLNDFLRQRQYQGLRDSTVSGLAEAILWCRRVAIGTLVIFWLFVLYERPKAGLAVTAFALAVAGLQGYLTRRRKRAGSSQ